MKKILKWTAIVLVSLFIVLFAAFKFLQHNTKKSSPGATAEYTDSKTGAKITVAYCRPYKRGRIIFDSLVPYGKVWRTGANEATVFTNSKDLEIGGKSLKAGEYTLWTIPGKENWTVIFNAKQYGWGVKFNRESSREPEADVLQVIVPAQYSEKPTEQFTISFEEDTTLHMVLAWDKTRVAVPMKE